MRFTVEARDLKKGLKTVALLSTSAEDVANVYVFAKDGEITLRTTGVSTSFPASIEQPGTAKLPGLVLSRFRKLRPFPKGNLTISIDRGIFIVQRLSLKHPQIGVLPSK